MLNRDKLTKINKSNVRASIKKFGVWQGIVLHRMPIIQDYKLYPLDYKDTLVYATLTSFASLNDINLLEFYNLS